MMDSAQAELLSASRQLSASVGAILIHLRVELSPDAMHGTTVLEPKHPHRERCRLVSMPGHDRRKRHQQRGGRRCQRVSTVGARHWCRADRCVVARASMDEAIGLVADGVFAAILALLFSATGARPKH